TSQAQIPKLSAVLSNSSPGSVPRGNRGHRLLRMRPSMVVHMWQMTYGFLAAHHGAQGSAARPEESALELAKRISRDEEHVLDRIARIASQPSSELESQLTEDGAA